MARPLQRSIARTREGYVQAKGRLQCWNADGQGLGGRCHEEAMQQLEDCKGGGRWREGFGGL